jgi:hypothetical protein
MGKKRSIVSSPGFIVAAVVIVIGMFVVLRLLSQ